MHAVRQRGGGIAWRCEECIVARLRAQLLLPAPASSLKAVELMQAMSATLAAAKTLSFTAVATYESPARTGQPLAYSPDLT